MDLVRDLQLHIGFVWSADPQSCGDQFPKKACEWPLANCAELGHLVRFAAHEIQYLEEVDNLVVEVLS